LATGAAACAAQSAATISRDEQYVEGLRRRGQFELAEKYCAEQLADSKLLDNRRVTLTIELSRTYADHAAQSPLEQQQELWQKARQVVDDFAASNPRHPRLVLVRAQAALTALAQGENTREDAEQSTDAQRELDEARKLLRSVVASLKQLTSAIDSALDQTGRPRRDESGQLSTAELSSRGSHVRHQWARALRNQGLCYPPGSADRINSLGQAIELLAGLARRELTPEFAWSVRLDAIACLRLIGNYRDAERQLSKAESDQPPDDVESRLRAEQIRLALARNRVDEALSAAGQPGAAGGPGAAAVAEAQLEAYLAAWKRAHERHDADEIDEWERAAIDQLRVIERALGPAVARRAETLLARTIAGSGAPRSPQVLVLAAQSLYRSGRLDEAQAAYDRAATGAAAGDKNAWFDIEYAAAALAAERGDHAAAASRFEKLARGVPKHARAADAHLLAVHSAAQAAAVQRPPDLGEYERLLSEHVKDWPDSPTAAQAWWWLGRVKEHQESWQEAIRAFRHVGPDHEQYTQAVEALGRCYQAALADVRRTGNPNDLLARDAVEYFESVIAPAAAGAPRSSPAARAATLAAARLYLTEVSAGGAKAEQLLTKALREDLDAPPEWKREANVHLVAALAASGQTSAADRMLKELPMGTTADALAMVELLATARQRANADGQGPLAQIELAAIEDLLAKRDELDAETVKKLGKRQFESLVELGRQGEAIEALKSLAEKYPRDGSLQEELAVRLAAGADADSLRAGLAKWRDVATHSRPGSPRWFRAHFAIARLQLNLGEKAQARATIRIVEASYPDFGDAEMNARFAQLLAETQR
jgi:TolA-binding protein